MQIRTIWVVEHEVVSIDEHCHNYFQMMICVGGSGTVGVGGVEYPMTAGDVCIALPMQNHFLRQETGMRLVEIKFLAEDGDFAQRLKMMPSNFRVRGEFFTERISRIVEEYYNDGAYAHEAVNCELYLLLIYFMRQCLGECDLPEGRAGAENASDSECQIKLKRNFDKIIEYVETHMDEPITLDRLCGLLHFDKSYFTSRFKEICGMAPMRYVAYIRLEHAKELLLATDMSITEIAARVGFSTVHYFSRYFKSKYGVSPQRYRMMSDNRKIRKQNFTKRENI